MSVSHRITLPMSLLSRQFIHPRYWLSFIGLAIMWLSIFLPAHSLRYLGQIVSVIMHPVLRKKRFIAQRNLALCFPKLSAQQRHTLLEENQRAIGAMLFETALSWWASKKRLEKRVAYTGLEHIDAALAKGKGVILLTGHFTSMEMGGRLIMLKYPCYVMFRQLSNKLFNAAMFKARTHHSEGIVLRDDPKTMIRALRKNKIVWYAPDQDLGHRASLFATFFGVTTACVPATARLAKITGAAIVPFVPRRNQKGHYTIDVGPAFEHYPSGDDVADAQYINDWLENEVRQSPEQYLWIHRRFKTQADGHGLLYAPDYFKKKKR